MLDVPFDWVRTFDLSSFTGDAWALEATLDVPPATVPRFIADGSPVRWAVSGMDDDGRDAEHEADDGTTFGTRLVKLGRVEQQSTGIPRLLSTTSGTNVNREFTEDDVSAGDVFVLAVVSLTAGGSPATYLWAYPISGVTIKAGSEATP